MKGEILCLKIKVGKKSKNQKPPRHPRSKTEPEYDGSMRILFLLAIFVCMVGWFNDKSINPQPSRFITDVSWPNCGQPLPQSPSGIIIGITGGLAFKPNPCLMQETTASRWVSVYANTGFPEGHKNASRFPNSPRHCSTKDESCLAYNYGYNSGVYDFDQALISGVLAKNWWVDVETENSWSDNPHINRTVLQGVVDALNPRVGNGLVGFYSYPAQWNIITGSWKNDYPAWVATGSSQTKDAVNACSQPGFNGGPVELTQYTSWLDVDYMCR